MLFLFVFFLSHSSFLSIGRRMYEQLAPPSVNYTLGVVIYLNIVRTGHLAVEVIQRQ